MAKIYARVDLHGESSSFLGNGYFVTKMYNVKGKCWIELTNCITLKAEIWMPYNQFIQHYRSVNHLLDRRGR